LDREVPQPPQKRDPAEFSKEQSSQRKYNFAPHREQKRAFSILKQLQREHCMRVAVDCQLAGIMQE
jgi:hypothetical protein